jgi:hypothetical protein
MRGSVVPLVVVAIFLTLGVPGASAQDSAPPTAPTGAGELAILDAHLEGSGPWTSWFGAGPSRELVLVLGNRGSAPVTGAELEIRFGRGADPTDPIAAPAIAPLEPGESAIVRVDVDLPTFAIGTYAVEGVVTSDGEPLPFRAETSHIPWVIVVLPLLILVQLSLLWSRNRLRDRIHRAPAQAAPPEVLEPVVIDLTAGDPHPLELETIIHQELDAVFEDAFARHTEQLDDDALQQLVVDLAHTAAVRVGDRADLSTAARAAVRTEMTDALLAAFDLAAPSPV